MSETGERPGAISPEFVRVAEARRALLALGLCRGRSVLDIGAGRGMLRMLADAAGIPIDYIGVDPTSNDKPGQGIVRMGAIEYLDNCPPNTVDTVIALEVIEHLDPSLQDLFINELLRVARRRVIISTPHPDGPKWYPLTEHFLGTDTNPFHTRLVSEWQVRRYMPGASAILTLHGRLEGNDEVVWGDHGPDAYYFMVLDK